MAKGKLTIINDELFKIGKYELIKISDENGVTSAVFKNCQFNSRFGNNNNFAESDILKKLTEEILPYIENIVGAEHVLEFETDLFSLDGSRKHGVVRSRISIPTFDFYRNNRAIFEKYNPNCWWWLATPDSTSEYTSDTWVRCVSPRGIIGDYDYIYYYDGVRPFLHFASTIFDALIK